MILNQNKIILDGGMGQTLIDRGMEPLGTLWSAAALVREKDHQLVVDTHVDFINAGAEIIVTNNFSVRRWRMEENNRIDFFEKAIHNAGRLALQAKEISEKRILIAGSLPTQGYTYQANMLHTEEEVAKDFQDIVNILDNYVDMFYLDVLCSLKEIKIACHAVQKTKKPILIGIHFNSKGEIPSGDDIEGLQEILTKYHCLGVIAACVSPEIFELVLPKLKKLKVPYGFKVNAFEAIPDNWTITTTSAAQPNTVLGKRKNFTSASFLNFVKKQHNEGCTFLGGCCEVMPQHIAALKKI